jgi:hypothetical protein
MADGGTGTEVFIALRHRLALLLNAAKFPRGSLVDWAIDSCQGHERIREDWLRIQRSPCKMSCRTRMKNGRGHEHKNRYLGLVCCATARVATPRWMFELHSG